jgi:sporulation protein YlmC with PRC-barrel domain
MTPAAGRVLHAQLHLLDRQLVDQADGHFAGKVDDVELDLKADPPVVAALICGRERIPAARIADIETAVTVVASGLDLDYYDDWVEQHVVDKIPGAGHAAE